MVLTLVQDRMARSLFLFCVTWPELHMRVGYVNAVLFCKNSLSAGISDIDPDVKKALEDIDEEVLRNPEEAQINHGLNGYHFENGLHTTTLLRAANLQAVDGLKVAERLAILAQEKADILDVCMKKNRRLKRVAAISTGVACVATVTTIGLLAARVFRS